MKKILFIMLVLAMVAGCSKAAEASGWRGEPCESWMASILNECHEVTHPEPPEQEPNREFFDYGAYAHLILWEAEGGNWEIGSWNTYEVGRNEITSLVGAKIYLNRLLWQKKGE